MSRRQLQPAHPTAQAIVKAVADAFQIKAAAVLDRGNQLAFKYAIYLLRRRGNLSLKEVAERAAVSIGRVSQIQGEIESKEFDPILEGILSQL